MSWTVIVPVKRLELAKSRLRGTLVPPLAAADHDALVIAMALDTVTAALASPVVGRVVVVTSDAATAEAVNAAGADVVPDVPDAGLNPALAYAAALLRRTSAQPPAVAALTADLPALRTAELTAALQSAGPGPRRYVTDATGTGTVLLTAPPGQQLEPCFDGSSAATHAASGAVELTGDWPTLRRDVDTATDLAAAIALGVGAHSAAAIEAAGVEAAGVEAGGVEAARVEAGGVGADGVDATAVGGSSMPPVVRTVVTTAPLLGR